MTSAKISKNRNKNGFGEWLLSFVWGFQKKSCICLLSWSIAILYLYPISLTFFNSKKLNKNRKGTNKCLANRRRKVQQRRSSTRSNQKHIIIRCPGSRYTAHAWPWSTATASWNQLHTGFCWRRKTWVPGEKPSEQGREPTHLLTRLTYDIHSRNWTWVTLVGGECSHHCAIPAPLVLALWNKVQHLAKLCPDLLNPCFPMIK